MLTQKYKQQQQQVRVQTSESNYAKGMFFSDVPLTEGYSKLLVNWDIDATTGKLTPRKGMHTTGLAQFSPTVFNKTFAFNEGYNRIVQTIPYASHAVVSNAQRNAVINDYVIALIYNTASKHACLANIPFEAKFATPPNQYPYIAATPIYDNSTKYAIRPYSLHKSERKLHGLQLAEHATEKPIGCFFGNNYYTFLVPAHPEETATPVKLARIPSSKYLDIANSSRISEVYPIGNPGEYFKAQLPPPGNSGYIETIDSPERASDAIYYYDSDGTLKEYYNSGYAAAGYASNEEAYLDLIAPDIKITGASKLCYAKLGKDIQPDDIMLREDLRNKVGDTQFYMCEIAPQKLNPSEAASWGYNMLLDDPYNFECEKTATNTITILGILPYDNSGKICLTPRKNQEITLKAYYRAPEAFHSNIKNGAFYATTKQWIEEGEDNNKTKRNPTTVEELPTELDNYKYGDWWYVEGTKEYYMVMPGTTLSDKRVALFGTSKPAASVQLTPTISKEAENKVRVHWQIRTVNSSSWVDVYNQEIELNSEHEPFTVTTTMSSDEVLVKLTISDPLDTDDLNQEYVLTTNTIGLSLVTDELATTLNLSPVKYDLGTCSGMCEWEQRLVVWGVHDALNTVFVSDVNNPTFFPYPNNIDTFPEPVLHVFNYGNELLVVTATALYRLTWDSEGLGWTHTLVQRNLRITQADIPMCCVVKNMFFFKSGEQYYMLVPKSSGVSGETTIAPVSKPIESLLNNFGAEFNEVLKTLLDKDEDIIKEMFSLVDYYSHVNGNIVVLNYVVDLKRNTTGTESVTDSAYITIQLMYDTDTRAWSTYIFETAHIPKAIQADTTRYQRYLQVMYAEDIGQYDYDAGTLAIALTGYKDDPFIAEDWMLPSKNDLSDSDVQYIENYEPEFNTNKNIVMHNYTLQNYQFLDTGNRDINTDMKKRFREFQFKMRNVNATSLGMKTSFLIDGSLRRDLQKFSPRYVTDESTGEAVIVIERTLDNNPDYLSFVPEYKITRVERVIASTKMVQDAGELTPTTLAESTDPDYWVIDQSAFPGRTFWKIRVAISGKGYTPRAQLLSTNLKSFEVLGHNWVYRTMHGR